MSTPETQGMPAPCILIMEMLLSELGENRFPYPYLLDFVKDAEGNNHLCLLLRPAHVMAHLSKSSCLWKKFYALPAKNKKNLTAQLIESGIVIQENVEKWINRHRTQRLVAISIERLERFGINATPKPKGKN